mgnify:CR=1 FL=1
MPAFNVRLRHLPSGLIDQGMRPARLIELDPDALNRLLEELGGTPASTAPDRSFSMYQTKSCNK